MPAHAAVNTVSKAFRAVTTAGLASALILAAGAARASEATVKVHYAASLGAFAIGNGSLNFTVDKDDYRADIGANVAGLAKIFSSRTAVATTVGSTGRSGVLPKAYQLTINGGQFINAVRMALTGGNVTNVDATPVRQTGDRIPLTPAHKKGVIDPISAFVLPVAKGADPFDRNNCNRVQKVFDGRVRYDLRLVYGAKSVIESKSPTDYSGPALVCAVAYRPIAGFRQLTEAERKFEENIEFSIWFVPVAGSNVMIPHRVHIGTPYGLLTVHATRFEVKGGSSTAEVSASDDRKKVAQR
jgi:Protein of unknown function (DUF3108)